ncbi:hypothetical protein [uncultured Amnibacterium sp.]|uniref:hypothetical protein n=1 Tax=uncultured Amnibacterium sp. TaxID=1631851 RepID=UPI0035CA7D00
MITFADSRAAPVSLWWSTSGCQTLDNGRVRAPQLASPSFARFQAAVRRALQERDARFTRT